MEELKIRVGETELAVNGGPETLKEASKDFYGYLAEKSRKEEEARLEVIERMKEKAAWYAKRFKEEKQCGMPEEKCEGGPATLRAVRTSSVSWGELARQIKAGDGLSIGDKVDFRLKNGEEVTVVVTQDTDEYVRFESVDCVGGKEIPWSSNGNTKGGIEASDVMAYLNKEIWEQLSDDLQAAIEPVVRKHKDYEGNVHEHEFSLFLPAASEVFDEDECYGDEGLYEQLEYYKDRRNRMKGETKGEDTCDWWLASVGSGSSTNACGVDNYGYAGPWNASDASRVPVCFHIKKS